MIGPVALLLIGAQAVNSSECEDCHPAIVESYASSGMARALGSVTADAFRGLASVLETSTGFRYRFESGAGTNRIVETRDGVPHRLSARIAFAIGAGRLDRSFAARLHRRLWFAPLEVVAAGPWGPRQAALAPGHAIRPGARFRVPISRECLACHTDRLPPETYPRNEAPPASWRPRGISCAACHSRASDHARWRTSELLGEAPSGEDPLADLASLERHLQVSICAACHLQGDARIELSAHPFALPPTGDDVLEHRAVFVARELAPRPGFVSQVERLVRSRCYLQAPTLTCTTCHDPHRSLDTPGEPERMRRACLGCHEPHPATGDASHGRAGDCVTCHMRRQPVFDVAHVTIHDHWIRRAPKALDPASDLRFPEAPDGDWRVFRWPNAPPPSYAGDPGLWAMALYRGGHLERAQGLVDRPSAFEALPMLHHVRGALFEVRGALARAATSYHRALELDPGLAEAAINLGALLGRAGRLDEGREVLNDVLERYPRADGALRNRALIRRAQGDLDGFLGDLESAASLLPDPALARALAAEWRRRGRPDRAAHWEAEARRLAGEGSLGPPPSAR